MSATRDARTAKRKLFELGITSATVLTGSTTITLDLAAFDEMHKRILATYRPFDENPRFGIGVGNFQHMCDPYGCEQHPHVKPSQP